jgi:hypothetical protein
MTSATRIRDPPCDANGVEVFPLVFHVSHSATRDEYRSDDRAGVMRSIFNKLSRALQKCKPQAVGPAGRWGAIAMGCHLTRETRVPSVLSNLWQAL